MAMHGSEDSDIQKMISPDAVGIAYEKSFRAVIHEGGSITQEQRPKLISARFHNAMTVAVVITPGKNGGSVIETFSKLDAGKVAFGGITVGQQILARYQQEVVF